MTPSISPGKEINEREASRRHINDETISFFFVWLIHRRVYHGILVLLWQVVLSCSFISFSTLTLINSRGLCVFCKIPKRYHKTIQTYKTPFTFIAIVHLNCTFWPPYFNWTVTGITVNYPQPQGPNWQLIQSFLLFLDFIQAWITVQNNRYLICTFIVKTCYFSSSLKASFLLN